ncbi:serpin family protein [Halobacteria archaeon AArc-m2/3/4]|uniref:Serpin family protein n=1 Tax=Natronoglomus mannanivorans TaxID=2979990 RepID=A0ABT2QFC4_9EURY|nr:serpin family protein [Halobacteria archaeon AArc-m2/3/4]
MRTTSDRRTVLALTGALLAGAAGCLSGDSESDPNDDGTGDDTSTETETESDPGDTDETGFDDYDVPAFPTLELATDPEIDEESLARQVRGNVDFSLDLLAQLRTEAPDENLFYSPYSVSVALAMTYAGARRETATEMADALRYELGQDDLHPAFGALEAEFARRNEDGQEVANAWGEENEDEDENEDDGPAFEFTTANAVWGQDGYGFSEEYLELLEAYYGAGMELVDFSGSPEEARQQINEWVEAQTNDRIEDLLPEGSIDAATKLVLTNAIYFVGKWEYPFSEEDTESGTFTALDGTESEVPMMFQSTKLSYAEIDGHQLVELPYANRDTSMVVILPAEGEFEAFENEFTVDRLATMLEEASTAIVDLTLPTFGIESEFSLVETMQELGMERAFGGGADFSGMDGSGGLFVDDIVHQSFVEVDELGTEAAAATAVIMAESAPPDHVEMVVDRPFLFYIRDRPTETPLFVGRVVDGETLQED